MTSRYIVPSAVMVGGALLLSCRLRDLTPGSSRHEEIAVQAATTLFYRALGDRDSSELDSAALPAATALVAGDTGSATLVPVRSMLVIAERRTGRGGARVVRSELHADGDVATDHVVVSPRAADGAEAVEASDWVTLARRGGTWRVAHAVFGPWRSRTAQ